MCYLHLPANALCDYEQVTDNRRHADAFGSAISTFGFQFYISPIMCAMLEEVYLPSWRISFALTYMPSASFNEQGSLLCSCAFMNIEHRSCKNKDYVCCRCLQVISRHCPLGDFLSLILLSVECLLAAAAAV